MTASALAVEEQDLAIHLFAAVDGPLADHAQAGIRRLWSECGTSFGLTEPIPLRGLPAELPEDLRELPDVAVVAGRQNSGAVSQAVLRRDYDVLTLSVLLAGQNGRGASPPRWPELHSLWRSSGEACATGLIGSGLLFLAKVADPARASQEVEPLLPVTPQAGWQRTGVSASGRLTAWEISAGDDLRAERRFVIVARHDADAEVSALTWSSGDAAMPSFARYLLHMAKIRYELRVHAGSRRAASLCQDCDAAIAEIRGLVSSADPPSRHLRASRLAALRRNGVEMAEMSMLLKGMRRTAEIAEANAMSALGAGLRGDCEQNLVADDRAVARSLIQRLDDDIAYLATALDGVHQVRQMTSGNAAARSDVGLAVVLCALNLEYLAVRAHLTSLRSHEHPAGTRFEAGELAGTGWQVALAVTGPGNIGAAVLAERAITLFDPDVLLCVGVAGSLKENVKLGDVVVATRVDAYHGGTAAADFLARPRTWPAPHRLDQLARELDRNPSWRDRLSAPPPGGPPAVHFRPIAAGEVVLDSRQSALFAQLRLHYNDAAAIEMEGAGIAQAAHFNDSLPALVIRGISDQADGTKATSDREGWQQRAAAHAAAFAVSLLHNLTPPNETV